MERVQLLMLAPITIVALGVALGLAVFAALGGLDSYESSRAPFAATPSFDASAEENDLQHISGFRLSRNTPAATDESAGWITPNAHGAFSIPEEEDALAS